MTASQPTRAERIQGGIVGLLTGDALGVPYEFKQPALLPAREQLELEPPPGFARSHAGVPPGTWSDDGAQALCLLESLLQCGRLDADDFARRLVNWYEWGHLAVDAQVFDVGIQTAQALRAIAAGVPFARAAPRDERANGNGALMRVLPLALWHRGSDAELFRDACLSSQVTHGHLRSQLCCALYCLWVRRMLEGEAEPWAAALSSLRALLGGDADALVELEQRICPERAPDSAGSGYVVDTLRSARLLLAQPSYEAVVKAAVALGHDTDTTAAVAGGAAGVRFGIQAIPARWREGLRGQALLEPLLARLLALR